MDRPKKKGIFLFIIILCTTIPAAMALVLPMADREVCAQAGGIEHPRDVTPPFDGPLKYPFTKNDSMECGRWRSGSQDYPYFGAPRDGNARRHAGIDLYPLQGAGTPVKAVRDGKVIRVAPFYTRRNGEVTYGVLVDHSDFTANYAELKKPPISPGAIIKQKQIIGVVSGTNQLHFELYKPGTKNWFSWYGSVVPPGLIDPTDMMIRVFDMKSGEPKE